MASATFVHGPPAGTIDHLIDKFMVNPALAAAQMAVGNAELFRHLDKHSQQRAMDIVQGRIAEATEIVHQKSRKRSHKRSNPSKRVSRCCVSGFLNFAPASTRVRPRIRHI
jgi:uncharacterized protein (DUF1778 family)